MLVHDKLDAMPLGEVIHAIELCSGDEQKAIDGTEITGTIKYGMVGSLVSAAPPRKPIPAISPSTRTNGLQRLLRRKFTADIHDNMGALALVIYRQCLDVPAPVGHPAVVDDMTGV